MHCSENTLFKALFFLDQQEKFATLNIKILISKQAIKGGSR